MGAVGYRLYAVRNVASGTNPSSAPKKSPDEVRRLIINSLKDKVRLDDRQLDEVQKVYQDQHEAFNKVHDKYQAQLDPLLDPIYKAANAERDQIHEASIAKIRALLRPDQLPLYEEWQAERAAAQADRKRQKQQHDRPDGRQRPPGPYPLP